MALENFNYLSDVIGIPIWVLIIASIWTLIWKGLALWKSAGRKQKTWFVILLVINTVGILEILYYYVFSEMKLDDDKNKSSSQKIRKKAMKKNKK